MVHKRQSGRTVRTAAAAAPSRTLSRRERERQARVDAICAAATRVFARQGYGQSSMEQVAHEAELGKATLYYYFETKHELFGAILAREHEALARLSRQHLERGASAIDAARAICRHWAEHFAAHPDLATLLLPVMTRGAAALHDELGDAVVAQMRAAHQPLLRALAALEAGPRRSGALPGLISTFVFGLVARAAGGQAPGAGAEIDLFFDLIERSLERRGK
jgi:AcrR family transcriptional regulator